MPDWFYRTISRPILFQLSPTFSRLIATGMMGSLSRLPGNLGPHIIEFLGHMLPPPTLQNTLLGTTIASPVGLGCHLDPDSRALLAWQHFGFGFLEIGPVSSASPHSDPSFAPPILRHAPSHTIEFGLPLKCTSPEILLQHLTALQHRLKTPLLIRWIIQPSESPQSAALSLNRFLSQIHQANLPLIHAVSIDRLIPSPGSDWPLAEWNNFWSVIPTSSPLPRLLWVCSPDDVPSRLPLAQSLQTQAQIHGLHIESRLLTPHSVIHGNVDLPALCSLVRNTRRDFATSSDLLVSGGIHQPQAAQSLLDAGASAILVDTGLIFSGPGLPKRINQCLHSSIQPPPSSPPTPSSTHPPHGTLLHQSWFWTLMLGIGMTIGGVMALAMATGPVIMPYDEVFCGLTASHLAAMNPKLLPFMSHDRVTLAGAMLSIGILYTTFSWFGIRSATPGYRTSILLSAGVGFASFFLFLGFDYFDPFHAFVTAILFQLFVQALTTEHQFSHNCPQPDWTETIAWRKAQWGQFLWIIHACGLLVAGIIIAWIGSTEVLVSTDQQFLGATPQIFRSQNARILPLIAHDRATLGGMLIAAGIPFLLATLWNVRKGERWLWHALLAAALIAYVPAIGIHFAIGYVHAFHLLPAFVGLALFLVGAALLHPWMTSKTKPETTTPARPTHPQT